MLAHSGRLMPMTSSRPHRDRSGIPRNEILKMKEKRLIATNIPGALWAGELTLQYTTLFKEIGSIPVPQYPLSSAQYWRGKYIENEMELTYTTVTVR